MQTGSGRRLRKHKKQQEKEEREQNLYFYFWNFSIFCVYSTNGFGGFRVELAEY